MKFVIAKTETKKEISNQPNTYVSGDRFCFGHDPM